jgi:cytochrome c553
MKTQIRRRPILFGLSLFALAGCQGTKPSDTQADLEGTKHVCSSCHGFDGKSISPTFPRLAAQQEEYLENQLKAFRDKTRADPHAHTYMWGMAARLNDATIKGLAQYYSSQKAADPTPGEAAEVSAGEKIFRNGIDARNVPACQNCHGEKAEGGGAIPRLASQHPSYLTAQMEAFAANSRANEIMHANVQGLQENEIAALAAYLAAQ